MRRVTRLFGRDAGDHPAPTFEDLKKGIEEARSGNFAAADRLAELLLATDRSGDTERADVALGALAEERPQTWLALDVATRRSDWMPAPAWADEVRTRLKRRSLAGLGVGLATFHPNVFIREEAVQQLIASPTPLTMPFLVIRTADWVSQVRTRAQSGLTSLLEPPSAEYIAAVAPLAVTLTRCKRGSFALDVARDAIQRGGEETVRLLLAQRDPGTRRLALAVAIDQALLNIDELVGLGVADPDPVCRLLAAESVNRDALVRRQGSDPADFYRRVLAGGASPSAAALAGVGETGTASDTHLVMPWLKHPKPRVRAEAVRALRRLGDVPVEDLVRLRRQLFVFPVLESPVTACVSAEWGSARRVACGTRTPTGLTGRPLGPAPVSVAFGPGGRVCGGAPVASVSDRARARLVHRQAVDCVIFTGISIGVAPAVTGPSDR